MLYRIILIFAVVILTFLTASSFLIHGHLESNGTEYMYLIRNGVDFYILLVALIGALSIKNRIDKHLKI